MLVCPATHGAGVSSEGFAVMTLGYVERTWF